MVKSDICRLAMIYELGGFYFDTAARSKVKALMKQYPKQNTQTINTTRELDIRTHLTCMIYIYIIYIYVIHIYSILFLWPDLIQVHFRVLF